MLNEKITKFENLAMWEHLDEIVYLEVWLFYVFTNEGKKKKYF